MTYESFSPTVGNESLYTALFEALPGMSILVKTDAPKFTIIAATPNYITHSGYAGKPLLGKGVFEAYPANNADPEHKGDKDLLSSFQQVLQSGEAHFLPIQRYDLQNTDGSFTEKHWRVSNKPVFAPSGEITYIIHTAEDITDQIKVEKRENDIKGIEKAFSLFMHAPMVVGLVNGDKYVLELANNEALKLWGKGPEEIIGKPILEGLPEMAGQGIIELFDQVRTSGQSFFANEVPVTSIVDGKQEQHYFNLVYQPYYNSGSSRATGVFTISHDVTEQVVSRQRAEQSENKYRSLFNTMDQGFCVIEMIFDESGRPVDYRFLEVNPLFESQTGLKDVCGKTAKELIPDLEEHWFQLYGEVFRSGKPARVTKGSGAMGRWFDVNAFRAGGEGDKTVAILFTDITEKRKAEQVMQENKQLLQTVFDASPNSITVFEPVENPDGSIEDFRIVMVNDYTIQTTGKTDLVGKRYAEEFPNVKENGILNRFIKTAATGEPADFEQWYDNEGFGHWFNFIVNKAGNLLVVTTANITTRKEAEEGLRQSERYFRQLTDTVPAIIWITRPDGYCTYLNKNWYDYTGHTKGEAEGFGWLNATHPDDAEEAGRRFMEATEKQQPFSIVYRLRHKSGEYRWAIDSGQPKLSTDGTFEGMIGTVVDVHEQKLAEDKIRESEVRFRSMADASPVMIWTLNQEGKSTYYNSRAREFTGHTEEDLEQGKTWQVAIHPDDIDYASGVVNNAAANRIPYEMECRMLDVKGRWRWLLNQGIPRFGQNGEYFGFVGSSIDITEQKNSRQALQTALEQMRLSKEAAELGTFDMDLEKGMMHWDDRCRTLFGISHHNTVTYEKDFVEGLHPDDRERILNVIEHLFIKSVSNGDYDVEYRTVGAEDGVIRWVRAKGKVFFNTQDKPVRFIGSVLDVTEKVMAIQRIEKLVEERTSELAAANERLQQVNKELQRSNQNLEEFAHAASHDLKEPVRKIHFFTHQLREQLAARLNDNESRSFSRIENATQRMGNLIDDLLLYSHVSQRPHETEAIDLNEKVKRVLEDLDLDIEEKGAIIRVGELPRVTGYRRQLQQVFQNLISNAIKYSKADIAPVVEITAQEVEREGKRFHQIIVKDNGIGFAQEYANKIFQMFTRLHGKAEYSGTGVGLSIVKKVVENHQGFIEVESEPGVGSTFMVYLPV